MTHDTSVVSEKVKKSIHKRTFIDSYWNLSSIKLFSNSMELYSIEDVSFFVKKIIQNKQNVYNYEFIEILSALCVNFLDYSYRQKSKINVDISFNYLNTLPSIPQFFIYKLLSRYYQALFQKDTQTKKEIKHTLYISGFKKFVNSLPN